MTAKLVSALISLTVMTFPTPSETPATGSHEAIANAIVHVAKAATNGDEEIAKTAKTIKMWVTAYTSVPEETDESPFETAMGTLTRDGIVATNMLPFGTKVQFPKLFGTKVFTVEDRMHRRKVGFIDIWMPLKSDALRFGINQTEVVVLN
jgi:3D (Asp-Asp-Asp) domain-containing protein